MRNIVCTLVILMLTSQAQADWSGFAHVTPSSEAELKLKVSMTPVENQPGKYSVKLEAVGYNHKLAWLIIAKNALSPDGQQLRDYIWSGAKTEQDILVKVKLMPTGIGGFAQKEETEKFYVIELSSNLIERSYIYIDFPSPVFDGGYYYSIDIGAYYRKMASSANKPLKATPKSGAP